MSKDYSEKIDKILEPLKLLGQMPGYGVMIKKQILALLQDAQVEAYEKGRRAGIAENQFEVLNRLRESHGKRPVTLGEVLANTKEDKTA